jgi:hypothetical protein
MPLIRFRCWKCRRKYSKAAAKIGTTFKCSCDYLIRVPKRNDGNCRVKTFADYVIEAVLCGGAGAMFGFFLSLLIVGRMRFFVPVQGAFLLVPLLTIGCAIIGFFGGMRTIDFFGDMFRRQDDDDRFLPPYS